jgi:hypothetical protein
MRPTAESAAPYPAHWISWIMKLDLGQATTPALADPKQPDRKRDEADRQKQSAHEHSPWRRLAYPALLSPCEPTLRRP